MPRRGKARAYNNLDNAEVVSWWNEGASIQEITEITGIHYWVIRRMLTTYLEEGKFLYTNLTITGNDVQKTAFRLAIRSFYTDYFNPNPYGGRFINSVQKFKRAFEGGAYTDGRIYYGIQGR